jgi:antirestriction protein ArdC
VLLWIAQNAGYRTPRYVTFRQAAELGGHVQKGEHGTKVYFVKQLAVHTEDGEETKACMVSMLREYTVFNVDQCEGLPASVMTAGAVKPRNPDERDATIDEFLSTTGADIREGHGEAYFVPSKDFISMPALPRSRAPRISTGLPSTNWGIGPARNQGLIVSKPWLPGLAMRPTPPKNW